MKVRNAIAIIAAASAIVISSCGEGFSVGERSGIVTKLSYKGIINKGWDGTLLMVGPPGVFIARPETLYFTINPIDTSTVRRLTEAKDKGERVTVKYSQWIMHPWSALKRDYVVTDVKQPIN